MEGGRGGGREIEEKEEGRRERGRDKGRERGDMGRGGGERGEGVVKVSRRTVGEVAHPYLSTLVEAKGSRVQGHLGLNNDFHVSLGYIRHVSKKQATTIISK